jgi:hypothetical protein
MNIKVTEVAYKFLTLEEERIKDLEVLAKKARRLYGLMDWVKYQKSSKLIIWHG